LKRISKSISLTRAFTFLREKNMYLYEKTKFKGDVNMDLSRGITKNILDWTDDRFEKVVSGEVKHPYAEAFALGAIEGAIDSAVIAFPILVGGCLYWKKKALSK